MLSSLAHDTHILVSTRVGKALGTDLQRWTGGVDLCLHINNDDLLIVDGEEKLFTSPWCQW